MTGTSQPFKLLITAKQLEQFAAVVELGAFTRAADQLCVTQPSITFGIKNLEEALGVTLFNRSGKSFITPTLQANGLYPLAKQVLSVMEAIQCSAATPEKIIIQDFTAASEMMRMRIFGDEVKQFIDGRLKLAGVSNV